MTRAFRLIAALSAATAMAMPAVAVSPAAAVRAASAPASSAAAPVDFTGSFEAGKTYFADVVYDAVALKIWRPVKEVEVAANSAWTIQWANLDKFPALKTPAVRAALQRFRFKVLSAAVESTSPRMPWTNVYRCELLAFEPSRTAAPAARRR